MASLAFWSHQDLGNEVILGGPSRGLDLAAVKNYLKFSMEGLAPSPGHVSFILDTLASALYSGPKQLAPTSLEVPAPLVYGSAGLCGQSVASISVYPGLPQPRLGGVGTGASNVLTS